MYETYYRFVRPPFRLVADPSMLFVSESAREGLSRLEYAVRDGKGVVVMTGAWSLTPLKESLGKSYFEDVGRALAAKLGLAFLVILTGTWVSFGICHRVVRAHQGMIPTTDHELERIRARLRVALWLVCVLTAVTIWYALGIRAGNPPA